MNINDQDYALVFTLHKDNKNKWMGDIDGNIVVSERNKDNADTQDMMMNMLTLLSTCVKLLETDKDFIQKVWETRDELDMNIDIKEPDVSSSLKQLDMLETLVEDKPNVIQTDGNVIKFNFTKGR